AIKNCVAALRLAGGDIARFADSHLDAHRGRRNFDLTADVWRKLGIHAGLQPCQSKLGVHLDASSILASQLGEHVLADGWVRKHLVRLKATFFHCRYVIARTSSIPGIDEIR